MAKTLPAESPMTVQGVQACNLGVPILAEELARFETANKPPPTRDYNIA
jgi:hypothetical protein